MAGKNKSALMRHTWAMDELGILLERVRKEVDEFVNEIRIARGTDMHVALASPSETQRMLESMNQTATNAGIQFQSFCDYVNYVSMIFDKSEAIEEISREFARIPRAIDGKE